MGISIISIILYHQHFLGGFPTGLFHNCGYWGVDVFLLLSGMGMVTSLRRNTLSAFYKRRILRLIPTCCFCGILKCTAMYFMDEKSFWSSISIESFMGIDLWFIRAIIIYYAISPILYFALRKNLIITLATLCMVYFINGFFFRVHDPASLTWIPERLLVFSLGMFWALRKELVNNRSLFVSSIFLCVALGIILFKGRPATNNVLWTCLMFSVALGSLSMVKAGVELFKNNKRYILFIPEFFGGISLELYLFHEFVFKWGNFFFEGLTSPHILFGACLLTSLLLSYTSHKIVDRLKRENRR